MRGRPIVQWLVFVLLWGLLLIPLTALTRARPPRIEAAERGSGERVPSWAALRFSHSPLAFSLSQDGRVLWSDDAPDGQRVEGEIGIAFEGESVELVLSIRWPEGEGWRAAELDIAPEGREERTQTVWQTGGRQTDVLRFRW